VLSRAGPLSWDFRAVWRIRSERIHIPPGLLPRVTVRVQGFSPSSRLSPLSALRVYFAPLAPFGFPLQGFLLQGSGPRSSRAPTILSLLGEPLFTTNKTRCRVSMGQRRMSPQVDSVVLLLLRARASETEIISVAGRSPPGLCPLQGGSRCDEMAHHHFSSRVLPVPALSRLPEPPRLPCTSEYCSPRRLGSLLRAPAPS